uniref:DUF4220 domain-containing protein n=1 Tax=Oryza rufipogon TaxID=4529 RepID=A0A0E0MUZ2_ORYRU
MSASYFFPLFSPFLLSLSLSLLVVLSSYRHRSGHPALRLFVWAASMLFLLLVSYVVSAAAKWDAARVPLLFAWIVFLQMLQNTIDTTRSSLSTIGNGSGNSKFRPTDRHLEEDSPGEEERDTRGIPLGGGGDGVGDEREEERGGRLDEEAKHRVAGAAAVGAEHDEEGK